MEGRSVGVAHKCPEGHAALTLTRLPRSEAPTMPRFRLSTKKAVQLPRLRGSVAPITNACTVTWARTHAHTHIFAVLVLTIGLVDLG